MKLSKIFTKGMKHLSSKEWNVLAHLKFSLLVIRSSKTVKPVTEKCSGALRVISSLEVVTSVTSETGIPGV